MIHCRIALVALHFAEYAVNLAIALSERNLVLLILYRNNAENELGQDWRERYTHPNLRIVDMPHPTKWLHVITNTQHIVKAVMRFQPNILHYQEGLRDEIILSLPFFVGIPKVLTVHDPIPHSGTDSLRLRYSRYRLYRSCIRKSCALAITHGAQLVTQLEQANPWLQNRIRKIPLGPMGAWTRDHVVPDTSAMRLLFFGRIHEYKGLPYFIEAVTRLRNEGLPVIGVVAGLGNDLERHRGLMTSTNAFKIIDRYIPGDEVPQLFLGCRAVVLPYLDGTQSGVAAVALGYSVPVIASAVGSIPELVRANQNGLLVPPRDVAALTAAIRSVVTDDHLWAKLCSGARALRDGELSWQNIAHQTESVYKPILVDKRSISSLLDR